MIRHSTSLNSDDSAVNIEIEEDSIEKIKEYIIARALEIEPTSVGYIRDKLEEIINVWKYKLDNKEMPVKFVKGDNPLISGFYDKSVIIKGIPTMTSMRNVDGEVGVKIFE